LASVIAELIRCRDTSARYIRIANREPTGRLRAISPTLNIVTLAYVNNLRAWARFYAQRLREADKVVREQTKHEADWDALLRKYFTEKWSAHLKRCAAWRP